eukprot:COSAG02_NODE_813_length_16901_cov_45.562135_6_plen_69_part_00
MQLSVFNCMYISMSYHYSRYEFLGPDSAGFRGGEVQFQVSEFSEPLRRGKTGKLQGYRPDLANLHLPL